MTKLHTLCEKICSFPSVESISSPFVAFGTSSFWSTVFQKLSEVKYDTNSAREGTSGKRYDGRVRGSLIIMSLNNKFNKSEVAVIKIYIKIRN